MHKRIFALFGVEVYVVLFDRAGFLPVDLLDWLVNLRCLPYCIPVSVWKEIFFKPDRRV